MDLSQTDPSLRQGGGGLGLGIGAEENANKMTEAGAFSESERTMYNARVASQNKMGVQKLAGMAGSIAGTAFGGPIGGAIGGAAGSLIGGML